MDTAVALVAAYLELNGYFVKVEVPVVERAGDDPDRFQQATDIDVLAIRFPAMVHRKPPRHREHWAGMVQVDESLGAPEDEMDVIVGEVKEGPSRLNPKLQSAEVLRAALWHSGGCEPHQIDGLVEELLRDGEARAVHCHGGSQRVRLVAFGGTRPENERKRYTVIHLADVVDFVRDTIADNHDVFKVIDTKDSVMGLMTLIDKLGLG